MFSGIFKDPKTLTKAAIYLLFLLISLVFFSQVVKNLYWSFYDDKKGEITEGIDFNAYMTGALLLKESPGDLYNIKAQKRVQTEYFGKEKVGTLAFLNTPTVAFLYIPLTFISKGEAYRISLIIQLFLTLILVSFLIKHFGFRNYLIPLLPLFLPLMIQPIMGQIAIVISIVILFVAIMTKSEKYFWAGVFSSFLILKIQHMILIPYLFIIIKNKREYTIGLLVGLLSFLLVDCLIYRGFYVFDYLKFLVQTEDSMMGTDTIQLLNFSSIFWLLNLGKKLRILISSFIYFISLFFVYRIAKIRSVGRMISLSIIFSLALNVHVNPVDLVFLLIPMFYFSGRKDTYSKTVTVLIFLVPLVTFLRWGWVTGLFLLFIGIFASGIFNSKIMPYFSLGGDDLHR
jgi:hypothetical protein